MAGSQYPDRERKRMVRLLIEDVTLIKHGPITLHVRFKGGANQTLTLPRPLPAWELRLTPGSSPKSIGYSTIIPKAKSLSCSTNAVCVPAKANPSMAV